MKSHYPETQLVQGEHPTAHVLRLRLHRPERRNAYNAQMIAELEQWLDWSEQQPAVRVVILTASGSVFCSGADLQAAFIDGGKGVRNSRGGFNPLQHLPRRKIWIAALNGHAFGGGLEMALECDFILASEQCKIALPEVRHGLLPLGGAITQLATRLPPPMAREMLLTGEAMAAQRALALGLFHQVLSVDRLAAAALALAEKISGNAPLAVQACNALLKQAQSVDLHAQSEAELRQLQRSEDYQESLRAYKEQRAPQWRGR